VTPLELLRGTKRAYIMAHQAPDGDAIGSALALGRALEKMGRQATLACEDPLPSMLAFLPGGERFEAREPGDEDLAIALDASDLGRFGSLGERVAQSGLPLLNIDHHVTNRFFGTVNLVKRDAAATAEIIYDLLPDLRIPLDPLLATCLLTGLVTDTQGFRTANTTVRTLEIATQLMKAGASLNEITERVFRGWDLSTLRLWGAIIESLRLDGRMVWATETRAMRSRYRASADRGDGVVNLLASVDQADMAIIFREREDGLIEVSLRSRPEVDVSSIAQYFGGGGHPQAAGCSLEGKLEEVMKEVLAKAKERLPSPLEG